MATMAALRELPEGEFSFIYTTGEREMSGGLPEASEWADRLNCGSRERGADVVDTKAGYVYDASSQDPPNPAWGLLPGPGTAEVFQYTDCDNGRIVADVVRLEKGHTEGLEPKVTEKLLDMLVAAPGGKIRNLD